MRQSLLALHTPNPQLTVVFAIGFRHFCGGMLLSTSSCGGPPLGLLSCSSLPPFPRVPSSSVCQTCGARGNLFCEKLQTSPHAPRQWCCVFCSTWNVTSTGFEQANEFAYSSYELPSSSPSSPSLSNHHAILVIDETLPAKELRNLGRELGQCLDNLPDDFYLGLVAFSSSVRVFELSTSSSGLVSCEVFSGLESPKVEDIRQMAKHERESQAQFVSPLYVCRQVVCEVLALLASLAEEREDEEEPIMRCLGPAMEYAYNLIKIHDAASSSVVCATSGRGTRGPGRWKLLVQDGAERSLLETEHKMACEYFHHMRTTLLSGMASTTTTHVFCTGPSVDFGLAAMLALTPNVYFASLANQHTLEHALAYNSAVKSPRVEMILTNGLVPMHICGAGSGSGGVQQRGQMWHFGANSALTVFLGAATATSATAEVGSDLEDSYVQWIAYDPVAGKERVGTERISSFGAVHEDACAVLIAKRAVAIALIHVDSLPSSSAAKQHVANELYNLSRCLPPAQFDRIALPLFHFYRGPLLDNGPGGQYGCDDLALERERFLHQTDFLAALLTMCPKLFALKRGSGGGNGEEPMEVALSTLSLESDTCLVLDQYYQVVVWFGNEVANESDRQRAMDLAHHLATSSNRFPACPVIPCNESSYAAAWLRCRLSPEHRHTESPNRALMSKLWNLPCDELTYTAFIHQVLNG
ncbi:hypothetical protein BASA81_008589 [Batrachochytrium salamandrivorans]|nr:hypothetical protein BASA81_008589 [Batrachochytrium salamandrivorans]